MRGHVVFGAIGFNQVHCEGWLFFLISFSNSIQESAENSEFGLFVLRVAVSWLGTHGERIVAVCGGSVLALLNQTGGQVAETCANDV